MTDFVALEPFLEAFRDAGYRGLPGALAELVDNSLEAGATRVDILIETGANCVERVVVVDNGCGIAPAQIPTALQFGGSTRFDNRSGFGRYGIGLPGSSISQARRLDVYSWLRPGAIWSSYLALDEIRARSMRAVPRPARRMPAVRIPEWAGDRGTLVVWSSCDRINALLPSDLLLLRDTLGRTFREALWAGRKVILNGEPIKPVDPLFLRPGVTPPAARPFGPPLHFEIELPGWGKGHCARVHVRYSELPIEKWYTLSNVEKRRLGITKNRGVSILRAGREIDLGWFFMGRKRQESYDDWWRCEMSFTPEFDELLGVAHTKQGIHPRPSLESILTPHLERTAHELNRRVRQRFHRLRQGDRKKTRSAQVATRRDHLLEPPQIAIARRKTHGGSQGLRYEVDHRPLGCRHFFSPQLRDGLLSLTLNTQHPFHSAIFRHDRRATGADAIELLLLAAARAEWRFRSSKERAAIIRHREHWSNALAAFFA